MRITQITNACAILESGGTRLLCDPWLSDGAFEGSWFHFPPVKHRPRDLGRIDAVYISHIHPDHFDPATLAQFPRDLLILVLKGPGDFLGKALERQGFTNVVALADRQVHQVGALRCQVLPPFCGHNFFDSSVGNLIDTALLVDDGRFRVMNANDNVPDAAAAARIREEFGPLSVMMVQYCAAGPFPSCFQNYSPEERREKHLWVKRRYLDLFVDIARAVRPDYMMPFAGDFVIAGSQWHKNEVLGTSTVDEAASYVHQQLPEQKMILLNEGLTFDLARGEIVNGQYRPFDVPERDRYIREELSRVVYPYQEDPPVTDWAFFDEALPRARANVWKWQQRLGFVPDLNIYVRIGDREFAFNFNGPECSFTAPNAGRREPYVLYQMDPRLLKRILERRAHWNNAEGGCHVDYIRRPDIYHPDMHTLLSFFQLPPNPINNPTPGSVDVSSDRSHS
jgi:UDP-MurNAc hydroxylase